jgi:hypothetical protein
MLPARFEPIIPASEWPHTHALDRAVTATFLIVLIINKVAATSVIFLSYWGAGKSLAPPRRKQATATEDFEFHISYL